MKYVPTYINFQILKHSPNQFQTHEITYFLTNSVKLSMHIT